MLAGLDVSADGEAEMLANTREFVTVSYDELLESSEDEGIFGLDPLTILISLEDAGLLEVVEL